MAVKQLQDVYSFRKTGLTCHKWKADTTKLKGIGEVDDPNEGVGEADDPDEGVGKANDPNKGVDEVDDPERQQAKLTILTWPCLVSMFAYIKKYLAPHAWC